MVGWLRSDHAGDESIRQGALLLLRVNRNRGLYQRIVRYPRGGLKKLEYEIRKHVNIRLQGYTIEDIERLDAQVTPMVQVAVEADEGDAGQGDIPSVREAAGEGGTGCVVVRGKRPDHDSLPEDIQAIWPKNAERWKRIKETYNLLLTLNAPCDRFEHLRLLKETWYAYKADMARYDDFKAGTAGEPAGLQLSDEQLRLIDNAQSYVSRNLPVLLELVLESREPDFPEEKAVKLEDLRSRLQERVNVLLGLGVELSEQRRGDLVRCGVSVEIPESDAQG